MNYRVHIIDTPAGRYTYVGSVPAALCDIVAASKADVMGGRAYKNVYGDLITAKPRVFSSYGEAWDTAISFGFEPIHDGRKF